jgi:hypothetical protein
MWGAAREERAAVVRSWEGPCVHDDNFLTAEGVANRIVDSSSIEVNRRLRRAKTDRMDTGCAAQVPPATAIAVTTLAF